MALRIAQVAPGRTAFPGYLDDVAGLCALKRGDGAGAERRFRHALEVYSTTLPANHTSFGTVRRDLASALQMEGRLDEARAAANEAVRIFSQNMDTGNPVLDEARQFAAQFAR